MNSGVEKVDYESMNSGFQRAEVNEPNLRTQMILKMLLGCFWNVLLGDTREKSITRTIGTLHLITPIKNLSGNCQYSTTDKVTTWDSHRVFALVRIPAAPLLIWFLS